MICIPIICRIIAVSWVNAAWNLRRRIRRFRSRNDSARRNRSSAAGAGQPADVAAVATVAISGDRIESARHVRSRARYRGQISQASRERASVPRAECVLCVVEARESNDARGGTARAPRRLEASSASRRATGSGAKRQRPSSAMAKPAKRASEAAAGKAGRARHRDGTRRVASDIRVWVVHDIASANMATRVAMGFSASASVKALARARGRDTRHETRDAAAAARSGLIARRWARATVLRIGLMFDNLWTYIGYFRGHFPNWSANWGPMVGERPSPALVYWWHWTMRTASDCQPDGGPTPRSVDAPPRLYADRQSSYASHPPPSTRAVQSSPLPISRAFPHSPSRRVASRRVVL